MFDSIKNYFREKALNAVSTASSKRKVEGRNFETTKIMGVVLPFRSDMDNVMNRIKTIAKENKIETTFLIYFPQDKLPETAFPTPSRIIFSNKECNWYGKPNDQDINNFIKRKFDILIDLSPEVWFPLQYTSAASCANFKIGRIDEEINPYDFLLLGSKTEDNFIKDLELYLHKIN